MSAPKRSAKDAGALTGTEQRAVKQAAAEARRTAGGKNTEHDVLAAIA